VVHLFLHHNRPLHQPPPFRHHCRRATNRRLALSPATSIGEPRIDDAPSHLLPPSASRQATHAPPRWRIPGYEGVGLPLQRPTMEEQGCGGGAGGHAMSPLRWRQGEEGHDGDRRGVTSPWACAARHQRVSTTHQEPSAAHQASPVSSLTPPRPNARRGHRDW
jgi:hypothetical protein